ncbi:hypothetical protein FIBSPDRAFT_883944 [Athelia psychrophila]|uniref:Uncharacterized protein n=1 Tax=Athelia psychrophila TaxID=1759441 RepID=A0A166TPA7_9AGAM|nr:hypothetical protein FIBSPDRAFT_883944 [Fibularhizoctonia sp. CBS 109695]
MSRSKFPAAITPNDLLMTAPPPSDREPVHHRTRRAAGCAAFVVLALLCAALFTWARWAPRSHKQHGLELVGELKSGAYKHIRWLNNRIANTPTKTAKTHCEDLRVLLLDESMSADRAGHPLADKGGAYSKLTHTQKEARTPGIYGHMCKKKRVKSDVFERKT